MDDETALFAEAAAARSLVAPTHDERTYFVELNERLPAAAEAAIMDAWRQWAVASNQIGSRRLSDGPCSPSTCVHFDRVAVEMYAIDATIESRAGLAIVDEPRARDGRRLHVCTTFCAERARMPELHGHRLTQELERGGLQIFNDGGQFYWCDAHQRIHACSGRCASRHTDERGFEKCVLSGRELSAPLRHEYGDGTQEAMDAAQTGNINALEAALNAAASDRDARATQIVSQSNAMVRMAAKRRRTSSNASVRSRGSAYERARLVPLAKDAVRPAAPRRLLEVDQDHWSVLEFDSRPSHNTFGFGVAELQRLYREIHEMIARLLFSDERSKIEEARLRSINAVALQRINNYRSETHKRGRVVFLDEAKRRYEEEHAGHWLPPHIIVGRGWLERLTAYYTMLALEFTVNIRALARRVEQTAKTSRALLRPKTERHTTLSKFIEFSSSLHTHAAANMVPSILHLVRQGWRENGLDIFSKDLFLHAIFFESSVMQELGVAEKICTRISTDIKQTVAASRDLRLETRELRATQLDFNAVVRTAPGSVVDAFLARRRVALA